MSSFVLLFYVSGVRPTTDYIHLVPLLSLIGIPLVLLMNKKNQTSVLFVSIVFIVVGFYSALFKGYYKWEAPVIEDVYFISQKNIKIWADQKYAQEIPILMDFVELCFI